ncbi:MAG: hypothetical protein M1816_005517 [Peltula sp. TS41687]|nr:MAG: hypothetical protein M1816_005517 [Peltula sp. TS41687]
MRGPLRRYSNTTALSSIGRSHDPPPVIRIENGTFYRDHPLNSVIPDPSNPPLFPKLNFRLPSFSQEPQHWSIIGPSLSGKTTLLEILRGQHLCIPHHARSFPYLSSDEIERKDRRLRVPGHAIQYVGFGGTSAGSTIGSNIKGAYLSARYESRREETDFSLLDYLKGHTQLNPAEDEPGSTGDERHIATVVKDLKLEGLLSLPVGNLSNGQTRRARIARALLGKPEVLLLDEPFMGLDPPTVSTLSPLLHRLAVANAPRLILSLRIQDPMPSWITHLIYLSSDAKITCQGHRSELTDELEKRIQFIGVDSGGSKDLQFQSYNDDGSSGQAKTKRKAPRRQPKNHRGEVLVEMEGAKVQYGDQVVLGGWEDSVDGDIKEGLYWSVRRGDRWGVFGPNGSGKTTLLSLICSDHPQTYALPIRIFGRSRLPQPGQPGISIFDLQARIGHSSPEVHNFFPRQLSVRRTLESAWADTFLGKPALTRERDQVVNACLRWFEADLNPTLAHDSKRNSEGADGTEQHPGGRKWEPQQVLATQLQAEVFLSGFLAWADSLRFGEIPFSAQRVALFLRAIIKKPDLIILDEAFSGMDDRLRDKCMLFLAHGEARTLNDPSTDQAREPGRKMGSVKLLDEKRARIKGLDKQQALICVSHVKEEVPGVVREWLSLPEPSVGQLPRFGRFKVPLSSDRRQWDEIWSP